MTAGIPIPSESTAAAELQALLRGTAANSLSGSSALDNLSSSAVAPAVNGQPHPLDGLSGAAALTPFQSDEHFRSADLSPEVNPFVTRSFDDPSGTSLPLFQSDEHFRSAGLSSEADPFVAHGFQFAPVFPPHTPPRSAPQHLSHSSTPSSSSSLISNPMPNHIVCISSPKLIAMSSDDLSR